MMYMSNTREHLNYSFPYLFIYFILFYLWWGLIKVQTTELYNQYVYLILLAVSVFKL